MTKHTFNVQVTYHGTITVEAKNIDDARDRVRELARPQGCFCEVLMNDGEDYEMDAFPDVHFLSHSQNPNTEDEQ